jgi:hypothetical protein
MNLPAVQYDKSVDRECEQEKKLNKRVAADTGRLTSVATILYPI